jgi:hemophore-related protein
VNHPRTWSPRRRAGLAVCGLAVAAVVAVPAAAWAESSPPSATAPATSRSTAAGPSTCTPAQRWDALAAAAPTIATYLDAHPDLGAELQTLRALPKDQRAAAAKTYFVAHPDERTAFRDARAGLRTSRATCHR